MCDQHQIDYPYESDEPSHTHAYLWGAVEEVLKSASTGAKVFDLGCGNGAFASRLAELGYDVTAVDPSADGISQAISTIAKTRQVVKFAVGNAYEPLAHEYGKFSAVVSLEVVEHVYYPRKLADCVGDLLEPGGVAIVSTPYHGYLKNLALAASGKMDEHFTALWDHGHIKFWSPKTLTQLFAESGLRCEKIMRVGRVPVLAKSMIGIFRKP